MAPRQMYRSLIIRGLSPAEAGNLTAYLAGLPMAGQRPWRLIEINRLLFLRSLIETGRVH